MSMDNVSTWLSTSWLLDEVINIDVGPDTIMPPRRFSLRYLRIQVIDTSPKYKVSFSEVVCDCVSAVSQSHQIAAVKFSNELLQDIDGASTATLRDCMQTVFEDGPRRDRRVWVGDLRLQALANYNTFRDFGLAKRCIFQFAAVVRTDGSLPACLFKKPRLSPSTDYLVDYDSLFAATVYDYVYASNDKTTGRQLWPVIIGCVQRAISHLDPETAAFEATRGKGYKFLDWATDLDTSAGAHGLLLFCLKAINQLARLLDKDMSFVGLVERMTVAASRFISIDKVFHIRAQSSD